MISLSIVVADATRARLFTFEQMESADGGHAQEMVERIALVQHEMGHACEWETSMMLRIRPELVGDLAKLEAVAFGNAFSPATRGWITKDRTAPGHIGDPRHATAEKGERLFEVFAADVVKMLERVLAWDGRSFDG